MNINSHDDLDNDGDVIMETNISDIESDSGVHDYNSGVPIQPDNVVLEDVQVLQAPRRQGLREHRSNWRNKYIFHAANINMKAAIQKYGDKSIDIIRKELQSMQSMNVWTLADIMILDNHHYRELTCKDGTLIVKLDKALYGCIESAKL
eukprot:gene18113-36892_t